MNNPLQATRYQAENYNRPKGPGIKPLSASGGLVRLCGLNKFFIHTQRSAYLTRYDSLLSKIEMVKTKHISTLCICHLYN